MIRLAALVLALMVALPATAQIYSWKDKDGRVHYADLPPPTGEVKTLRGPARPAVEPTADEASADAISAGDTAPQTPDASVDAETAFRERRAAEADAAAKAAANEAKEIERERFCTQARGQLAGLKSGQRIARMNAAGEREFLDDTARNEEIGRLEQQIEQNCN